MLINIIHALVQLAFMASALTACPVTTLDLNTTSASASGHATPTSAMTKEVALADNSETAFKAQIMALNIEAATGMVDKAAKHLQTVNCTWEDLPLSVCIQAQRLGKPKPDRRCFQVMYTSRCKIPLYHTARQRLRVTRGRCQPGSSSPS